MSASYFQKKNVEKEKKGGRQGVGKSKQMHQNLKLFDLSKECMDVNCTIFIFAIWEVWKFSK